MLVRVTLDLELVHNEPEQLVTDVTEWFRNRAWEFTEHDGEDLLNIDVEVYG